MEDSLSKVYIKIDNRNRILRCEGGYTIQNIDNIDEWVFIDEGEGDKFNLCQSNYFEKDIITFEGVPRYKYENGLCIERTIEEISLDTLMPPENVLEPSIDEDVWSLLSLAILEGINNVD